MRLKTVGMRGKTRIQTISRQQLDGFIKLDWSGR